MKTSSSSPVLTVARLALFLFVLGLFGLPLNAQIPKTEQTEYKIGTLTIRFMGSANVNEQVVRANIQMREGMELDDSIIDRDIRSLYRTGLFEFIEVKREVKPDHTVNLVVEVTPKYRVLAVKFDGASKVKPSRLEKEIKSKPNSALDERQIKEDAEKLREYYQKTGYNQVFISYSIDRNRDTGFGTVIFKIKEGERVKIAEIRFAGNEHVKSRKLRKQMETRRWWMFSWLTGTGRLKDDVFEDDIDKLRDFYREEGFLDVEIPQEKIAYDYPKPNRLVLTIKVTEGRQYHIGDITITGNKLHPTLLLRYVLQQRKGMVFTPSKLDKDVESLEDFYGKDGYIDTRVRLIRKPNIATGNIDIEYEINESEQFNVESIKLEGNSKTKSVVILRELLLGPGEVFNMVRMKMSKLRLENTRFFEDVNLTPETTNIPGRRNLKVAVKEARTGNLTFGAGFSTLEQGMVFAELTQGNFDMFNRRSFFQGDGQKFRLRLQYGQKSTEAIITFEEPAVFQRELALGFSIYRTTTNYDNSYYDDIRTGGEVYIRKRLFELFEGRLSYGYEIAEITNVTPGYEVYIPAGQTKISKVGFQLLRENRDKIINTTAGNRIEIDTELAGGPFGGGLDFYRIEARGAQFFPLFQEQAQSLAVITRLGVVDNYGRTKAFPYFEGYFLGGPNTLRGFEYHDVGPKNPAGQAIGGKSYGFVSFEYSLDIVSPIRFAVFYDGGFVNRGAYDFNPASYNDDFGFGLRLFVAGAPLSLDYGIPITGDKTNRKGGQFNFSFGTRF